MKAHVGPETTTRELIYILDNAANQFALGPKGQARIADKLRKLAEIEDVLACEKDDKGRLETRWLANYVRYIINDTPMPEEKIDNRPKQPEPITPNYTDTLTARVTKAEAEIQNLKKEVGI